MWLEWLLSILKPWVPKPVPTPPTPEEQSTWEVASKLLDAHNEYRKRYNINGLMLNPKLISAASKHATWMYYNQNMNHTGNRNSTPMDRVKAEGYVPSAIGENIAMGYDIESIMNRWINSSGHRANIIGKRYTHAGFGKHGKYWCAVFASSTLSNAILTFGIIEAYPDPIEK